MFGLRKKSLPEVGMILEDKIWGATYTRIKITRISKNKKYVMYKFLVCKGSVICSGDEYDSHWKDGILSTYSVLISS